MRNIIIALMVAALSAASAAGEAAPSPRHVIYLHGRIVQDQQSARPLHERHGHYELDAIRAALWKRGFVVHSEIRPKSTTVSAGADRAVEQVRELLRSGVPPERILVLGASMGAAITLRAAARLREPGVRFALLGPCLSASIPAVTAEEGAPPSGRILAIRDESDVPSSECKAWTDEKQARELVINTGLGHGFLYRPLDVWLEPVVQWAKAPETRDVVYASPGGTPLKLDAHVPEGKGPFPIAILVHGGGNKGDKQTYVTPLFAPLSAASFTWFTIDFRPAKAGFAASVADVQQAIRWVKANASRYKGDPTRVALIGESSGGILALLAAGRAAGDAKVDAVVAFYTPADLGYIVQHGDIPDMVREYWGIAKDADLKAWQREWSPITYARALPPVLLIHGTADSKVPFDNARRLDAALQEAGVARALVAVKDGDHGMGSWETVDATYKEKMVEWLRVTLKVR